MKKFACVLTALTLFGAATPAKAQYFFADSGSIAVGADAYAASSWWGGPGYAYSSPGLVYSSPGYASFSWWGGAGYGYGSYSRWSGPGYRYSGWWGGPGGAYAFAPGYEAYAAVPTCRIVNMRQHLADGRVIIRRTRMC